MSDKKYLLPYWQEIRDGLDKERRIIQCISNFVTVNDCANIILAAGAAPMMSDDIREVEETIERASALVCNLGAIAKVDSMLLAGKKANKLDIPIVFDPVAAGGSELRYAAAKKICKDLELTAIRANVSEMKCLYEDKRYYCGVDVSTSDELTDLNMSNTIEEAKSLAKSLNTIIVATGKTDIITDGRKLVLLNNGCSTMSLVTGCGCMLSSLVATYLSVAKNHKFEAVCLAVATMGIAGDIAEMKRISERSGNASFRMHLIDAVYNMNYKALNRIIRMSYFN